MSCTFALERASCSARHRSTPRALRCTAHALLCLALAALLPAMPVGAETPLDLRTAGDLAVERDPRISRFVADQQRAREAAVAAGSLPDPQLIVGAMNIPIDSPGVDADPANQIQIGVMQQFPSGRRAARERLAAGAGVARAQERNAALEARRDAELAWLALYEQQRTLALLERSRSHFDDLVDRSDRERAAGRVSRQEVLRAELERDRLEDRIDRARTARDEARADLARWIGTHAASRPLTEELPGSEPRDEDLDAAIQALNAHPLLATERARIEVARAGVDEAEAAYRPDFGAQVSYGYRDADMPDGSGVSDVISAMVTVQLPLFPGNRQDRQVAAGQAELRSIQQAQRSTRQDLERALTTAWSRWLRQGDRLDRYQERLIHLANDSAEAALDAYRAGTIDFSEVLRARIDDLETRLDALSVRVQRAESLSRLQYLTGGMDHE